MLDLLIINEAAPQNKFFIVCGPSEGYWHHVEKENPQDVAWAADASLFWSF